jgi:hypothetical protein
MKLIENVGSAHKMYVVQVLGLIALLNGVWAELPPEFKAQFGPGFIHYANITLAALGVVVRVIKQFWPEAAADVAGGNFPPTEQLNGATIEAPTTTPEGPK